MRLTSQELSDWADQFYAAQGMKREWTRLAQDAGAKIVTLSVQRRRNDVDVSVVLKASRAHGVNPLSELRKIPRFSHLPEEPTTPTMRQLVAPLNPGHILKELSERALSQPPRNQPLENWAEYPHRLAALIDIEGGEGAREVLQSILGIKASALSNRLNSLSVFPSDEVIQGFPEVGLDPVYGLVLTGHLYAYEAGYPHDVREVGLKRIEDEELLNLSSQQAKYLRRDLADLRIVENHAVLN